MWLILGAVTASKPIRLANHDQASSVKGTASSTVSSTAGRVKKRSRKEILLSDDESTAGEKTLTIHMRHTISKAPSSEAGNSTLEAVKSLFEELKVERTL